MQTRTFPLIAGLFMTVSLAVAQSDEEAIKTLLKNETTAFYQRQADAWEAGWLHDAKISRAVIANNSYQTAVGWEKHGPEAVGYLKANAGKPVPAEFTTDNYLIRMGTDMAWVEYDQNMTMPTLDPKYKRYSREQRLMVKQNGQWKIAHQVTVDPNTFKPDPENVEANLNANGYYLLQAKKVNEAIEVFKTNVKLYPDSWNAYDSLGEAYAAAGDKKSAIQHYEQSLKLNPKSEAGKTALAKLKQ